MNRATHHSSKSFHSFGRACAVITATRLRVFESLQPAPVLRRAAAEPVRPNAETADRPGNSGHLVARDGRYAFDGTEP
jgi:hypothetical protein